MKIWNLTEFAEIEETVLSTYSTPEKQARPSLRRTYRPVRIRLLTGFAALMASITVGSAHANSPKVIIPLSAMAVAQSIPQDKPPLEAVFASRFDREWTAAVENQLLAKLDDRRSRLSRSALLEQTVDSVWANQQEEVSPEVNRLDKGQVAVIARKRKLVR